MATPAHLYDTIDTLSSGFLKALPGASVYVYSPGTTNQVQCYSDSLLSIPKVQPLGSDSSGVLDVYVSGAQFVDLLITYPGLAAFTVKNVWVPGTSNTPGSTIFYGGTANSTASAAANVTAWNTAVALVPASGGQIYINAGNYYINATLQITRSNVKVYAEPGTTFTNVAGFYDVTMLVSDWNGGTAITGVLLEGITFDGQGYAKDIAATPGVGTDSRFGGGTYSIVATSGSTTTFTKVGSNWPVNTFAGNYLMVSTSANGNTNLSRLILSNTNTTITVASAFPGTLSGDTAFVLTQPGNWASRGATGWGQTFGHSGLMFRKVGQSEVRNCKIVNYFNTGTTWNQCNGSDYTRNCYVENVGASHIWDSTAQPNNAIDVLGNTAAPSYGYWLVDNTVVRCYGLYIEAHGAGALGVHASRNFAGILPYIPGAAPWGIAAEIESELADNVDFEFDNNFIYNMPYGVILTANGNTTYSFKQARIHNNTIWGGGTGSIGIEYAGQGVSIENNFVQAETPVDNNQAFGSGSTNQDILISGNTLIGNAARPGLQLRAQNGTTWKKVRITNNKFIGDRTVSDSCTAIYIGTVTATAVINDTTIERNEFHDYYHAIWQNFETAGAITSTRIIDNDYYDSVNADFLFSAGTGIEVIGGKSRGAGASSTASLNSTFVTSVIGLMPTVPSLGHYVVTDAQYGAKGDGATNDSTAIAAAALAASTAGGGTIYFPGRRTYLASAIPVYSNCIYDLDGSTIKQPNGANTDVFQVPNFATLTGGNTTGGSYRFEIRNGRIDGNRSNNASGRHGLALYGIGVVDNVLVHDCHGSALWAEWSNTPSQLVALGLADGDQTFRVRNFEAYDCDLATVVPGSDAPVTPTGGGAGITAVTNSSNPTITTAQMHLLRAGQTVTIANVNGATGVNGTWTVLAVPSATTFTITTTAPGVFSASAASTITTPVRAMVVMKGVDSPHLRDIELFQQISVVPGGRGILIACSGAALQNIHIYQNFATAIDFGNGNNSRVEGFYCGGHDQGILIRQNYLQMTNWFISSSFSNSIGLDYQSVGGACQLGQGRVDTLSSGSFCVRIWNTSTWWATINCVGDGGSNTSTLYTAPNGSAGFHGAIYNLGNGVNAAPASLVNYT